MLDHIAALIHSFIPPAYRGEIHCAPITLKKYAILGTGCIVHPGVMLGEGAAVGSAALVLNSLDRWCVYVGIPAKLYKTRERLRILEYEKALRSSTEQGGLFDGERVSGMDVLAPV